MYIYNYYYYYYKKEETKPGYKASWHYKFGAPSYSAPGVTVRFARP